MRELLKLERSGRRPWRRAGLGRNAFGERDENRVGPLAAAQRLRLQLQLRLRHCSTALDGCDVDGTGTGQRMSPKEGAAQPEPQPPSTPRRDWRPTEQQRRRKHNCGQSRGRRPLVGRLGGRGLQLAALVVLLCPPQPAAPSWQSARSRAVKGTKRPPRSTR